MERQKNKIEKLRQQERFWDTFADLREDPGVCSLKKYPNHRVSNLYDHSSRVALCAYDLSRRLHLSVDGSALAKGAMLHDFYFYKAQGNEEIPYREHLFGHPMVALENARTRFSLTKKEENIITSHMWPLTILHVPRSKEAVLVSVADKICAFGEGVLRHTTIKKQHLKKAQAFRKPEKALTQA